MSEMVERVARAACSNWYDMVVASYGPDRADWSEAAQEGWKAAITMARAAIEAMREPTAEMAEAGDDIAIYHPDDIIRNQAEPIYQAMIDAALSTHLNAKEQGA